MILFIKYNDFSNKLMHDPATEAFISDINPTHNCVIRTESGKKSEKNFMVIINKNL
jgi:hypothetical protein